MTALDTLSSDFVAFQTAQPDQRVYLGLDDNVGALDDPSLAFEEARVADARALLARLDSLDPDAESFDRKLDLDLVRLSLERAIHDGTYTWNGRTRLQQMPNAGQGVTEGLFLIFTNDPRPAEARLADVLARVQQVPAFLDAMIDRLDHPLQRWVSMDLEKVEEAPDLLDTVCGWADEVAWSEAETLEEAAAKATDALASYAERLEAMPTTKALHLNEADARSLVRLRGVELSLEELHAVARDWLSTTGAQIEALRKNIVRRHGLDPAMPTAELHRWLNAKFAVDIGDGPLEKVLDRYQEERKKILGFIRERDLFEIPDDQDMNILRTPGFMEPSIPAGAMMPPPPLREGTRRSLVYLTLSDELLPEHTELSIPGMMIHEGIPGHHLQLATSALNDSPVRRIYDSADYAEGWTTMLEDYMLDLGYMGDLEEEARFTGKRDLSRIGARVVLDLFFMTGNRDFLDVGLDVDTSDPDPFVAAGKLLKEVTGFVDGRVEAELNWYSQERGYPLSYLLGNVTVWQLKRDLEAADNGLEGLDLDRTFHRIMLRSANMPIAWLRRVFVDRGLLTA
ncbi:MAG: DUF885 domain-containing protein [Proteobacteria bacterium]|nr:DUF885 domain-containing protein [Pseudomonadota bacterium]